MEIITIPCLFDNYAYLVRHEERQDVIVIDPAESWPVLRELQSRDLTLTAVLCTHHHRDHVGGIEELLEEFPDLRVLGFEADRQRIPELNELLKEGDTIFISGLSGQVLRTPGHTETSLAYRFGDELFVGDTLFGAGCGRLFEGTAEQMMGSLARIVACGEQVRLYFGHEYTMKNLRFAAQLEPDNRDIEQRIKRVAELRDRARPSAPSTVVEELRTNPFLRCDTPAVIDSLAAEVGLVDRSPRAVFRALRELRNDF